VRFAVGTFDFWEGLLGEDDPDPLEIIRAAGMYSRYLDAVVVRAATEATRCGASAQDLSTAYGHPNKRPP
jgi:hypothetical protein